MATKTSKPAPKKAAPKKSTKPAATKATKTPVKSSTSMLKKSVVIGPTGRLALLVVEVVIIILGLLFLARGWVRVSVIPRSTGVFYAHSVESTMDDEIAKLGDPLRKLGYTNIDVTKAHCQLSVAKSIHTEVYCTATEHAFGPITSNEQAKAALNDQAIKLQAQLAANGWEGANTTLTELVSNITKGIDYTPDAGYQKNIGKVSCLFDSNTAFNSPDAPAMASIFTCTRAIEVFGNPWPPNGFIDGQKPY